MKLARFEDANGIHIGKVADGHIINLSTALPQLPLSMRALIANMDTYKKEMEEVASPKIPLSDIKLLAPIDDPQKFLAIGVNYKPHRDEALAAGFDLPEIQYQLWFNKQVSCINGPYSPIEMPRVSDQLDYEAEMAVVIGKRCRHVSRDNARDVIAGYMIVNDVSVRDWQKRTGTMTLGKSFDTHGPIGPWITTDDEIQDPHNLNIRLTVNGDQRQSSSTSRMIANVYDQIAYLSTVMTLEPGDILATGTPEGVGIATGNFLKVGDVVRIEIDQLGVIENKVVAE